MDYGKVEVLHSLIWGTVISIVFGSLIWGITYYNLKNSLAYYEKGYHEEMMPCGKIVTRGK